MAVSAGAGHQATPVGEDDCPPAVAADPVPVGSGRRLGLRGGVGRDPFPAHGALVSAADDEVDLSDGPRRQRLADMPAAVVAGVRPSV
jgi:hypothetical protein